MHDNTEIKKFLNNWAKIVAKYQTPNKTKAISQIITSFGPFIAVWILMYYSLGWSYWITLGLAVLNAFSLFVFLLFSMIVDTNPFLHQKRRIMRWELFAVFLV